jgi:hypothetical protein
MMPSSFKGAQKKITHRPVPITPALAAALKRATSDRPGDAPLLLKRGGSAWAGHEHQRPPRSIPSCG